MTAIVNDIGKTRLLGSSINATPSEGRGKLEGNRNEQIGRLDLSAAQKADLWQQWKQSTRLR